LPDWNALAPWLGAGVGFGLVTGWAVGFLAKKVAKLAALLLALIFIGIQLLVANHLLVVNWHGVAAGFEQMTQHMSSQSAHWRSLLMMNFPYAGSFAVGFFMGFRKG